MMDTSFGLARTRFGAGGANRGDDGGGGRTAISAKPENVP